MDSVIIIFSDKTICIKSKKDLKVFNFSQYKVSYNDIDYYSDFIVESLKKFYKKTQGVHLIPDEYFTSTNIRYSDYIKKNHEDIPSELSKSSYDILNLENTSEFNVKMPIQRIVELYSNKDKCSNFNQIPVLGKYFIKETEFVWDETIKRIYAKLEKSGYRVKSVTPLNLVNSNLTNSCEGSIGSISIHEDFSCICIYEDGLIQSQKRIELGYKSLMEKVSDYFNISLSNSRLLVEKYAYLFLPKKYYDFVIDVKVYQDMVKEIELIELSYIFREECKQILENLIYQSDNPLSVKKKTKYLSYYSEFSIRGIEQLLEMMTGSECYPIDYSEFGMEEILTAISSVKEFTGEFIPEYTTPKKVEKNTSKPSVVDVYNKAKGYLHNQLNQHLLDDGK